MARAMQESRETIRIPLIQSENNKIEPGFSSTSTSVSSGKREQQYINCYPVFSQSGSTQEKEAFLCTRMGFFGDTVNVQNPLSLPATTTYPKAVLGFKSLTNCIIASYFDSTNSRTYIIQVVPGLSSLGYISGEWNVYLSELMLNNVPHLGIIFDNGTTSKGYWVASSAGTFAGQSIAEITDVNFPSKQTPAKRVMGRMVQLNNRVYVLSADGYIWNTDNHSITSWPTLGFKEVSSSPDQGVALARYKHHIVAFGTSSVEFFNDEIDGDSPLRRTDQAYLNFGLVSPNAVISIDDTLYWVAKSSDGAQGLWKLDGYTPTLLSQPFESYWLRGGTITGSGKIPSIDLQVISMHGMRHIITNLVGSHSMGWLPGTFGATDSYAPDNTNLWGTAVYCIDTNTWWWLAYENTDTPSVNIPKIGTQVLVAHNNSTNSQYIFNVGYTGLYPIVIGPTYQTVAYWNGIDKDVLTSLVGSCFRIPVGVITNGTDFGSSNRKEIHRVTLVCDTPWSSINNSQNPDNDLMYRPFTFEQFYFYFLSVKDDFSSSNGLWNWDTRQTVWRKDYYSPDYTTFQRLYWNRFGHGRKWRFAFMTNHMIPLRMKALDLEVTKGIH